RDDEDAAEHRVVFHDEDERTVHDAWAPAERRGSSGACTEAGDTGSVNSTTAPPPVLSPTAIRPPWARTMALQMVRPRPTPPSPWPTPRRRYIFPKTFPLSSSELPGRSPATRPVPAPFTSAACTERVASGPPYRAPFSSKFNKTCSTSNGSADTRGKSSSIST